MLGIQWHRLYLDLHTILIVGHHLAYTSNEEWVGLVAHVEHDSSFDIWWARIFVPKDISEGGSDGADVKEGAESRIVGKGELDISESGSIHVR